MNLNSCPTPHPQVAAQIIDDEAVIVLADVCEVNVLDPVGTRIWELIDGERTIRQIIDHIVEEYQVTLEEVERDVQEFLETLVKDKIVELRD